MLHEIHTSNGTYDPLGFEDVALEYDCNPPEIAVHVLVPTAGIPRTINVEEEEEEESDAILLEAWSKGEAQPLAYRDKKFAVAFWVHIALLMLAAPFAPSAIKSIVKDEANIDKNRFLRNVNLAVNPRNTRVRRVEAGKRGELKKSIRRSNAADYGYDGPFDGGSPGYGYDGPFDGGQGTKAVGSGDSASSGGARYGYDGPFDGNHFYPGYDSGDYYGDSASSGGARYGYDGPFDGSDSFGGFDVSRAIEFSILVVIASLAISFGLIMGALHYLQLQSEKVIKGSLFCIIGYLTLFGSLTLFLPAREADEDGKAAMAIVYFVLALIFACYAKVIWRDIPYAAVTLRTGVTACRANIGVFSFAFFSPLLNFIMFIIQTMAFIAVLSLFGAFEDDPSDSAAAGSTFAFLFFCLSIYWTSEVIKNISTVIVSGTVGTWWVAPLEASSFCSIAVLDSIRRATTYSFGSICYGSLIVAILNVIIDSLRRFRGNSNCILFYCCIQCILQFLERIAVYFNKWAMIHVGIYGYDFMTAGKNVVTLFKARGWTSIISSNLVSRALTMVAVFIGLATGLLITMVWNIFELGDSEEQVVTAFSYIYFYAAFVISFLTANILLSVVSTACDTAIVCFAEGSAEFEHNHPELSIIMNETYADAYPEVQFHHEII